MAIFKSSEKKSKSKSGKVENSWTVGSETKKKTPVVTLIFLIVFTGVLIFLCAVVFKKTQNSVNITPDSQLQGVPMEHEQRDSVLDVSSVPSESEVTEHLIDSTGQTLQVTDPTESTEYFFTMCKQLELMIEKTNSLQTYEDIETAFNTTSYILTSFLLKYSTTDVNKANAASLCISDVEDTAALQELDKGDYLSLEEEVPSYLPDGSDGSDGSTLYIGSDLFCRIASDVGAKELQRYTTELINYSSMVQLQLSAYIVSDLNNINIDNLNLPTGYHLDLYKASRTKLLEELKDSPYKNKLSYSFLQTVSGSNAHH